MPKSKKKLYLHIGRHKTGTSSLQNFFAQKSESLAEKGILYPKTGRLTRHGALATAHHSFSDILKTKPLSEIEALFSELADEAVGFESILLSSEDFQNQQDFELLDKLFKPYDLTVVCYLREGLGYGLSSFAQRIHFGEEIFNIRQYIQQQNIRISGFMNQWGRLADQAIFRLYERDKLKNRDIIDDFLEIIELQNFGDTQIVLESNPSLSGNLLSLKMLLNLIGQSQLAHYNAYEKAAALDSSFQGKINISDRVAEELRGLNDYNAVLKTIFPDMSEPSFEGGSKLFDLARWDADMDLIATLPELSFAKALRLGALYQILNAHGMSSELAELDFLTPDFIEAIRLPPNSYVKQIRERAVAAASDATLARKARREAEYVAAQAKEEARRANARRDEMAEKLKFRTKKLEKDLSQLVVKADSLRAEKETSLEKFNKTIADLTSERDAVSQKLKAATTKAASDADGFKAQLETVAVERDTARAELKSQAERAQAEAKTALGVFNTKVSKLSDERKTLAESLKTLREKTAADLDVLKKQADKAIQDRDAARALVKQKDAQLQKQAGQVYYFRAELLSLKGDAAKAQEIYAKAVECDPDNADYKAKLER